MKVRIPRKKKKAIIKKHGRYSYQLELAAIRLSRVTKQQILNAFGYNDDSLFNQPFNIYKYLMDENTT